MTAKGAPKSISITNCGKFEWVMVKKNDQRVLKYLKDKFGFAEIDLKDVGPPIQSPKIVYRADYVFMVLQYPIFDKKTGRIHTAEIDFFIMDNRLVTVDVNEVPALQQLYKEMTVSKNLTKEAQTIPHLLYMLINSLIENTYPILRLMSGDIEEIEDTMFDNFGRNFIKNLLRVKTNIVRSRQSLQGHDEIMRKLRAHFDKYYKKHKKLDAYYGQLIDDTSDIKNRLLLKKETIDALHETYQSLTEYRTNEIVKNLTIVSFIVFPLTLLAGVFGMNAINMPLVDHPWGFWIIVGIMLAGCTSMLAFFKYKKWM
ncbi:hypothetical protein GF391_02085 [Candidatus Uhrbacteria bacterium]|nr:hypothetical protein [Candidatus Uhrbacteria bacterium]